MQRMNLPPAGFGPGSQPPADDGSGLDYLAFPSGMRTFAPSLPEIEDADRVALAPVLALLGATADAARAAAANGATTRLPLGGLEPRSRKLLAETLGEGEVSCLLTGTPEIRMQESVFAGVWVVRGPDGEHIEVGPVPHDILAHAFEPQAPAVGVLAERRPGLANAPAVAVELMERSRAWTPGAATHVVNLSLLPHTPEDLAYLDEALGSGRARILSRGYGNCRITATALDAVWRVQFFNSMDTLILDTFEVSAIPDAAVAATEDFDDSAGRIAEVMEALR